MFTIFMMNSIPWLELFNQTLTEPDQLPRLLSAHGLTADQLVQMGTNQPTSNEPYSRKILFRSDNIEVMLAHWKHQGVAAPHNHGRSQGLIWFARGQFSEKHFTFTQNQLSEKKQPEYFFNNQVVKVESSDIHSCHSLGEGVSLHIYSPPISKMKVWDLKNRRTLTVADHCGAWVPTNEELIVESQLWDQMNAQTS